MTLTQGPPPSAVLLSAIMVEAAGNPFFITELMHLSAQRSLTYSSEHAIIAGRAIPRSVRGAIRQRIERLSVACNTLLAMGAVIGREWSMARCCACTVCRRAR